MRLPPHPDKGTRLRPMRKPHHHATSRPASSTSCGNPPPKSLGTGPTTARAKAEILRERLLDILQRADGPLTTAALRENVQPWAPGLVNEAVYHSLLILEARGNVSRIRAKGRRYVVWDVLVLPRPKRDANARK